MVSENKPAGTVDAKTHVNVPGVPEGVIGIVPPKPFAIIKAIADICSSVAAIWDKLVPSSMVAGVKFVIVDKVLQTGFNDNNLTFKRFSNIS